ncbi:MAG: hypothetical protein E6G39_16395 [Actinobacteria bacterium]|nr:MAG: hypothetical protein E6G39_16395 [Actinomycetota bacterium]
MRSTYVANSPPSECPKKAESTASMRYRARPRLRREDFGVARVGCGSEVAGTHLNRLADGAHAIADPDDEYRWELRGELHETDDVDRAREHPVRVADVQHCRRCRIRRAAVPDEDLEFVTDVLRAQEMHLGVGERRSIVRGHGGAFSRP